MRRGRSTPLSATPGRAEAVSRFGPVLAEDRQGGYVKRVHDLHPGEPGVPVRIDADDRDDVRAAGGRPYPEPEGVMSIESPTGAVVRAGFWMDWAETSFPAGYERLPKAERAALELEEQKRHGYAKGFKFHFDRSPAGEALEAVRLRRRAAAVAARARRR